MHLNHNHIMDSDNGTLITNFAANRREAMAQAIREFDPKGESNLVISDDGFDKNNRKIPDYCSLHCLDGMFPADMSDFWNIYRRISGTN